MEFATGALGSLLPKLAELLHGEYKLQRSVRKNIEFLIKELESIQSALRSVGEVPLEQLPELVKIWARDARELSYDMEDVVDTFLVRIQGPDRPSRRSTRKFIKKITKTMFTLGARHQIGEQIKDIKERVVELAARRDRYKDHYTINPEASTIDPRIQIMQTKATDLVGMDKAKEELVGMLQEHRIVSIVGFGGLGKTTLAKAVYEDIKSQFDCTAFITVSQNPDMKMFLKKLLYALGERGDVQNCSLDENQLIDIAREVLHDKRYLIIIDDIWKISDCNIIIKQALPQDNTGCRIITTTRIVSVAKHIGHDYKMQPLSPNSSRVLLYRRIFGNEDPEKCHVEELAEVSDRILKKCAGVPLAIITIASLLASKGRNKIEWEEVYNSIGNGMENSLDADNMRKILSYSYYDLPSNLRTCLLYLSIFPEDFTIKKDRLIWLWIAEGFIQHSDQWKKSLFELGESYFNELINRSMIQPLYSYEIWACRVHDMVLDLIRSISSKENFVSILSSIDQPSPSTTARRLSLQNGKLDCAITKSNRSMSLVRSVVVFPSALDQMPTLRNFQVLRVLDLQDCGLSQGYSLQYLGSLIHLRYLSLRGTRIHQLPEEVGNLQFLEILDLGYTNIRQLPKCVFWLTHLLCLSIPYEASIPNCIKRLASLEELTGLHIDNESSSDIIEGLGLLTKLRVLNIVLPSFETEKLVDSLCKLRKIQSLNISYSSISPGQDLSSELDVWVPPPQFRRLSIRHGWFKGLPMLMNNPTQFQCLSELRIAVRELQQEDLVVLGRLPALDTLQLTVDHKDLGIVGRRFVVYAGLFPRLVECRLWGFLYPVMFQHGSMPMLSRLYFNLFVPEARKIAGNNGGFDNGLGNLLSLQNVWIWVRSGSASEEEVQEVKAAMRLAADIYPNRPRLNLLYDSSFWAPREIQTMNCALG